ncbi:haloacid dehalogenase [Actinomyces radicidentis]|uniref:Haloacid dehalogenase n=1 Tax=Actinomyces radicidentis TaxID=111015 RepID=A0A0X8JE22_ACTRD|nr:HAD-IIB family hydrolase [Actinomyces radicidentis]AMD86921.1 haloacid dehalogenase [Actinomyces radicidentis]
MTPETTPDDDRLPVGTSPVFGGPTPDDGGGRAPAGSGERRPGRPVRAAETVVAGPAGTGSGALPDGALGGSPEYVDGGWPARLDHDAYHALVRERVADLDRLDPERERLVPEPRLLVALDVDGTILDMAGRVSERVMAAVARLRTYGAQVVISTGRGVQAALPVARHVGLTDGWMVCANGALTLRMDPDAPGGYEVVESLTFDPAPAIDRLHAALPEAIVATEDLEHGFRGSRRFPEGELIETQTVVDLDELRAEPVTRIILRAPGVPVEEFTAAVDAAGLEAVEYAIGWTAWLDVAPGGVTKASALESLAARVGSDASRAVAVGDGTNDLAMLTWAGAGAVMGSAPQEVKDVGDLVTADVWRDGCAAVLDAVIERTRDLA